MKRSTSNNRLPTPVDVGARLCAKHQPQQRENSRIFHHSGRCFQKTMLRLASSTAALRANIETRLFVIRHSSLDI
jgi:hypothetical protein